MPPTLSIRLLGELEVAIDGVARPLPPSKKTRALLGYLALTGRAHRRERLAELLWDVADDPRAALRWSLSKLRDVVGAERLVTDAGSVALDLRGASVDALDARRLATADPERAPTPDLERAAALFRGELLEGLELEDFAAYHAFLLAERADPRRLHARVLEALLARAGDDRERALPLARRLAELDPADERRRGRLLALLRGDEARDRAAADHRLLVDDRPAAAAPPPAPATTLTARLVGRQVERERLRRFGADRAPRARVLLLAGEPGMGKSRLLDEALRGAAPPATVLAARALDASPGWPFAPWLEPLRAAADDEARAALAPLLGETQGETSRERLFHAAAALVTRRAARGLVLLTVDDAHWLDDASAALLAHVVRQNLAAPLRVVLAARPGELADNAAVLRVIRALRRDRVLEELPLGPLSADETVALVRSVADTSPATAAAIAAESGGHPLYAIELARAGGGAPLPGNISHLVRERLETLPAAAAEALRWGAVLGASFDAHALARLAAADDLAATLEQLERHGWLRFEAGSTRVAFAHDLVRRAVYDGLSEPRRRLHHARVAALLEHAGAAAAEVAHHAALAGDAALAARASLAAARRCLRLFADADARALARRALGFAAELPEPERTTLSIELLEVQLRARRPAPGDDTEPRLAELAARALDLGATDHARQACFLRSYLVWERGDAALARRLSLEAERISRLGGDRERVFGLADAARCLAKLERDLPEAEALLLEAETIAARAGLSLAVVPLARGFVLIRRDELAAAAAALDDARARARAAGDRLVELHALEARVEVDLLAGRAAAAADAAGELVALGERTREGSHAPGARALAALVRWSAGRGDAAAFDDAFAALAVVDDKARSAELLVHAAGLELAAGRRDAAAARAREAERLATLMERPCTLAAARALLSRAENREE